MKQYRLLESKNFGAIFDHAVYFYIIAMEECEKNSLLSNSLKHYRCVNEHIQY
ncbi:hypothetical protein RICGR_0984 [Rickettsiella grylli]|uniref:Uncharacterized protein n=1 Tax=Rickettsiella grylli TaxID=59196 RepID=A8PNE6_9COXI|nr:hypothetical protein RICGR_0984 [Rickettsiella grylli]